MEHKVNVKCRIHGGFLTNGWGHLKGKGCPTCADIRVGQTLDNFLTRSAEVHGDTYDYNKVEYVRSQDKVEIVCKVHAKSFWQTPSCHYSGKGCPDCGVRGYKTTKPGCLYVFHDLDADMTKVGITNNKVTKRLAQVNCPGNKFKVVAEFWFDDGSIALGLETKFLKRLRGTFSQPSEKFGGSTECFYNVDVTKLLSEIQLSEVPNEPSSDKK